MILRGDGTFHSLLIKADDYMCAPSPGIACYILGLTGVLIGLSVCAADIGMPPYLPVPW